MGTRADFYIGRGQEAEWIGSIEWDGHAETVMAKRWKPDAPNKLARSKTAKQFRKRLLDRMRHRDDFVRPPMPWPWPWADSRLTDRVYAFDEGQVWIDTAEETEPESKWVPVADELARLAQPDFDEPIVLTPEMIQAWADISFMDTPTSRYPRMRR